MHEVVPGTTVRFGKDGRTTRTYWELTAQPHGDDLDTTIAQVRELLDDIVRRQLIADVPVGTLLSGGLDSSALTALAAKTFRDQGRSERVKAFSIDFKGNDEAFAGNGSGRTPTPRTPSRSPSTAAPSTSWSSWRTPTSWTSPSAPGCCAARTSPSPPATWSTRCCTCAPR